MNTRTLLGLGLWMTATWAAAADLVVTRVSEPASMLRAGNQTPLTAQRKVAAGDVISAGSRGKVGLQLGGTGAMTLSSLGDLQIYEAKAGTAKQPTVAKLKLLAGALRVDSRATNGKPAQDIRLNVGSLKTRLYNADAWAANTAEGDTLCVLAGAASVQTGSGAEERLDAPGSCLRREPDGQLSRFSSESDAVIVGAIAATRFEGGGEVVSTLLAEAEEEAQSLAQPAAASIIAAPPLRAAAQPPTPKADAAGGWTVVVLSLSTPEPVAARAEALSAKGLPATTRTAQVKGVTMHRVAVGSFATQAEARAYAAGPLAKSGIKGWASPL